jgi:hypothetical protein
MAREIQRPASVSAQMPPAARWAKKKPRGPAMHDRQPQRRAPRLMSFGPPKSMLLLFGSPVPSPVSPARVNF